MSLLGDLIKYENVPLGTPTRLVPGANGATTGLRAPNGRIVQDFNSPSAKRNFFKKRAITVDDMTGAAANWTVSGATKSDSSEFIRKDFNCNNALKLSDCGSFVSAQRTINTKFTGTIDIWIYLSAEIPVGLALSFWVSKDAFATTNIMWGATQALMLRAGWNRISLNTAEDGSTYNPGTTAPTITGVTTFADTMNAIRIYASSAHLPSPETGLPISIHIGGIFYGGEGKSNVILNWDDAFSDQWDIFNLYRSKGLTGSISVIPNIVGFGGLTLNQLHEIYDWGWDVVNHTMQQSAGNLLLDSDAEVRRKIGVARDWMIANGFSRTANVLVWPENSYSVRLVNIAAEYGITLARGSRNTNTRTFQAIDNPMRLGSSDFGGKTLAQAKKWLDAAELYKGTVIMYGHRMIGTATSPAAGGAAPVDTLFWNQSDYIAFADDICDRVTAGTISNINYSQLLQECRI